MVTVASQQPTVTSETTYELLLLESPYAREERLTAWFVGIAIAAVALGILLGLLQALEHAGIDLYPYLTPFIHSYYQGLTLHGVLNALVWTTFFIYVPILMLESGLGATAGGLAVAAGNLMLLNNLLARGWADRHSLRVVLGLTFLAAAALTLAAGLLTRWLPAIAGATMVAAPLSAA